MVFASASASAPRQKTYDAAYRSILAARRRSPSASAASVVMLVAPEVDALCAARMLSALFKQDDVPYRIVPVASFQGLTDIRDELMQHAELCALVMINIGGSLDIPSEDWFGGLSPQVTVHIIDSSRPQSLQNLFGQGPAAQRVVVWDDGNADTLQKQKEALHANVDPDDASSSDESDSEEDEESDQPSDDEDGEDRSERISRRRRRRRKLDNSEDPGLSTEQKRQYLAIINKHYGVGRWYGQSAAGSIYVLATILKRADNDLLWLSILGLTFQFITSRIPRDRYNTYHAIYLDEVARLNPPEDDTSSSVLHPDDSKIRTSEELRFSLFRHWNLYDSMYHSSYVANKLGIWQERGRKKLQGLLAKMGFSLQQCQQSFQHMDMDLKRQLRRQMDAIAPEYGLVDLSYPSFVRSFGFRSQPLCAADVVESVSALLQAAGGVRLEVETMGGQGGGEWFGGGHMWDLARKTGEKNGAITDRWKSGNTEAAATGEDELAGADGSGSTAEKWWIKNFWVAFDALGSDISLVQQALPLSMALQRAIIRQGSSLIDKRAIRTFRTFRLATLKDGPDLQTFCNAGTLSRLGLWLSEALRDRQASSQAKGKKAVPFIIACLNEKTNTFLVVGVTSTTEFGDVRKNRFSTAFISAKDRSHARAKFLTFDTSVVELDREDLTNFLEELQDE